MTRVLLAAPALLTGAEHGEVLTDAGVLCEDGRIASVGARASVQRAAPRAEVVELGGDLVLPGMTDAHSHGRGLPLPFQGIPDAPLPQWILRNAAAAPTDPYDEALVAGAELAATGVTAVQLMVHTFGGADEVRDLVTRTVAAVREVGLKAELVVGASDRAELAPGWLEVPADLRSVLEVDRTLDADAMLAVLDELLADPGAVGVDGDEVRLALGPVGPQWTSPRLLDGVGELARRYDVRVHTHLLEDASQRDWIPEEDPIEALQRADLLGPRLSVAHGVWLTPAERRGLAIDGVTLVTNPSSNVRLSVGTAPVREWLDAEASVALGFDSNTATTPPDAFAELRSLRRRARRRGGELSAAEALAAATTGGGAALGRHRGVLETGADADMVVVGSGGGLAAGARAGDAETAVGAIAETTDRGAIRSVWIGGAPVAGAEGGTSPRVTPVGPEPEAVAEARRRLRATAAAHRDTRDRVLAQCAPAERLLADALAAP